MYTELFCITKTDAARPHGQRGKHLTHAQQQQEHAHQQWHPDHSDHSRPSLIQNHHSQKYNILSQQLHEKTPGQVENPLDRRETLPYERNDTLAYILHRTMGASRCHVYGPKERQQDPPHPQMFGSHCTHILSAYYTKHHDVKYSQHKQPCLFPCSEMRSGSCTRSVCMGKHHTALTLHHGVPTTVPQRSYRTTRP